MKKNDLILSAILLVTAILLFAAFNIFASKKGENVEIFVDGSLYKKVSLSQDEIITITGSSGGTNVLVIKDLKVYMKEADCPDKVCVHQGSISRSNETIVCLPNRIVVKITGKADSPDAFAQ